jgi:hypothetical protein
MYLADVMCTLPRKEELVCVDDVEGWGEQCSVSRDEE